MEDNTLIFHDKSVNSHLDGGRIALNEMHKNSITVL